MVALFCPNPGVPIPITPDEIHALGEAWCDTLRHGGSIAEREAFFLHHPARIYVQATGEAITLDAHHAYHAQFSVQVLRLGSFTVTALSDAPERARALGSLYWEAHFPDGTTPPLACVVGEDWMVERTPGGALKFVLWINTMHHFLAESGVSRLLLPGKG